MKNTLIGLNIIVLLFMIAFLPFYFYYGNESILLLRNAYYLICLLASSIVLFFFIIKIKFNHKLFPLCFFLLFTFFSWTLLNLTISYLYLGVPDAQSDIVRLSYCFFALVFSIGLPQISHKKYFTGLIFIIWSMIFYFVVSKIDPITLESVYGENDPKFAGVYQYLGDTFALVSMILASKILVIKKIPPTDLILKKVKNSHQYLRLNFVIFILISSVAVLFFNGSRASFFCFILVVPYLIFDSFVKWFDLRKMIFVCLLLVSSIYVVKITNNLPNFDSSTVLFSNRNLSAVETGSDASLDERLYYYDLGIQDIIKNPIFGNYSERIIQRGSGTYIHNLLATFQNFGFPAFLSYLSLIIICIKQFLNSWKSFNDSECMLFNSLLIFNVVQILGFRQPLGFYVIFVNFGLALRRLSKHRLNL